MIKTDTNNHSIPHSINDRRTGVHYNFFRNIVVFMILLIIAILPAAAYAESAGCNIEFHFLNAGQSDSAIAICDGKVLMIDGGNAESSSKIYSYITEVLKIDTIDFMVSTNPSGNSVNGLIAASKACEVKNMYAPCDTCDSKTFASLKDSLGESGVNINVPAQGDCFELR